MLIGLPVSSGAAGLFDVRADGAVGDGRTLCTAALQRTIDRCAEAGGGTVVFPAGTYLSGTLVLKSHVTLELPAGATLLGSPDPKDYPPRASVLPSYTDNYVQQALIAGENLTHVTLRGQGTINGNGGAFRWKEYRNRPYVIRLVQCRDVTVEGITLRDSPMWMQHYLACDRVRIHRVNVFNHVSYNNDGLDLDGCHDVVVSDCVIDSDDDALCLKSTVDRACENIVISNCILSSHCNAFKLGTESNGGFRQITLSNCVIRSPRFSQAIYGMQRGLGGIALELVDGGQLEGITITNVSIDGVNVPLFLRLGDRGRPIRAAAPRPPVGSFQNVRISNVVATRAGRIGCSITGVPARALENVTLAHVSLEFEGGGIRAAASRVVPERVDAYPESRMFGELPACGLYARHVSGLTLSEVRIRTLAPDARHVVVCDDVDDLELDQLRLEAAPGAAAVLRFTDVQRAIVRDNRLEGRADAFLSIGGERSAEVRLVGNEVPGVVHVVQPDSSAAADAVMVR